jgi:hypothetical protein
MKLKDLFRRAPEEMTPDELTTYISELTVRRKELGAEISRVHLILQDRLSRDRAARKLAAMTDPEKAALAQELQAQGITSSETFGDLGAS